MRTRASYWAPKRRRDLQKIGENSRRRDSARSGSAGVTGRRRQREVHASRCFRAQIERVSTPARRIDIRSCRRE